MSKYQELCSAFMQAYGQFTNYREECHDFAAGLFNYLAHWLEVPPSNIQLISIGPNGGYAPASSLPDAMMPTEDGSWYFGIGVALSQDYLRTSEEMVVFHLFIRKENGGFTARLGPEGRKFALDADNLETFGPFCEFAFQTTLTGMAAQWKSLSLPPREEQRPIGFKVS
jgi:hypothetical protein